MFYKMKRTIYLSLLFAFSGLQLMAQVGNINIFSPQNVHFFVYLDGKLQHSEPKTNLRITDVPEGNYNIKLEFYNSGIPSVQTYGKMVAKKETAFMLMFKEGNGATFEEYSSVPLGEVNVQVNIPKYTYNREGVTKNANAKVTENTDVYAGKAQTGVITGTDVENRVTPVDTKPKETTTTPEPVRENGKKEEITEVKSYRTKTNSDGTQVIVCERLITTKTTVYENGLELVANDEVKKTRSTDFTCLPKGDTEFAPVLKVIEVAADKLAEAKKQTDKSCLAPDQLTAVAALLPTEAEQKEYALFAKPFCASPSDYPLQKYLPSDIAKVENTTTTTVVENNTNTNTTTVVENNTTNTTTNTNTDTTNTTHPKTQKGKKEKKPKKGKESVQ